MKIFITTLGRLDNQQTLVQLAEQDRPITLVVQHHEYEQHLSKYGDKHEVVGLPRTITKLGATRKYLCSMYRRHKLLLLDDDLTFYVRKSPQDWHLVKTTPDSLASILDDVDRCLTEYAHVGVSAREGNNRVSETHMENTRYMRLLGYNPTLFPTGLELGRVDGMSDFDLNLQLLRKGMPSITLFWCAQNHPGTQTPGGCSLNRSHQTHEAEIKKMLEWHSPFVKARQKVNKGGGEFGTRTELTIYWKKAFESSQQKTPAG